MITCAGFFVSVFLGLLLCLTLEFPFTALLKELVAGKAGKELSEIEKESVELGANNNNNNNSNMKYDI